MWSWAWCCPWDDALVREMIFAYGAYEDTLNGPAVLTVRKKSLFHRMESWGAGDLTPGDSFLF